ncbi:exported polysaccharide deacetylase [Amylolactobacillus amylotrophicus DSM 20534]|uniref:Uncharacterized protein n=4 Tax=Amylolactobacillus TaxID=2767876 RepID=A0A1L6XC55_9LACO|nr:MULTISPECIES: polysaccharide deacetylase family protein [Amylolactobacillus]APT18542.1 hypothetical protein LA20533_04360 [Amylolactobacillus amylophilus DSM 20533 = JCM 1125]KRK37608.1 exported polysaccharide deacetylase [Amylolactobacillus amylotrophicus DSM 20534]KRM43583.1 exported polysaccharide deacetylase [Amylolactobacillus amylophilus DSM 20533 = JCM 1125]GED80324.1 hypothetical protein LAM01_07970 [Amylolactobacillus amylophilus]
MFRTIVFHEIRPEEEIATGQRDIAVNDGYNDRLPMPLYNNVQNFEQQMKWLQESGYHFLTLDEIKDFYANGTELPARSVHVTFDDCYQSVKKYAYPLLKQLGIQATYFIPTGWVFEEPHAYDAAHSRALSFPELKQMTDVFEFANHTNHFHQRHGISESRIMWAAKEDFIRDIKECNKYKLVTQKDVFGYPFGLYDDQSPQTLSEQGFKLAFTCDSGFNTADTNPLLLKREVISDSLGLDGFKQLFA